MTSFVQPTRWGATLLDAQRTRFRLWAPDAAPLLEIEGATPLPMTPEGDGWFVVEAPVGAGARYRFRVSPDLAVPDPASRQQAGDVHDASVVVDPRGYAWRHPEWAGRPWHEVVLYEVHAGLLGGFSGVEAELPRLRDLGVTAIELMPIGAFPGARNWGYDGVLPYAPDATLGTPEALKSLIDAAHGLGLMVFLDVVYNHFGPDGAYLHAYAKRFFNEGVHTPWGAAIDFRQPAVRAYFEENALLWLNEYRFDGLRFDAVHAIAEADWLDTLATRIRRETGGREVHLVLENERNAARHLRPKGDFDAQWNDDGHNVLHPLLTGEREGYYEDFCEAGAEKLAKVLAEGFLFQGSIPAISACRAENLRPTCRPRPSSCSSRTTTRSATGPSANASTRWRIRPAWPRRPHCCCSRRRSRCCSWARNGPPARPSCSSPTTMRIGAVGPRGAAQ
ncbi:alpha-amylase family glycosyl hydrolase [Siccirubricoccus deserti]